jgi:starch-binding outer membrane protein, SusD/RagB family
MKKILFVMPLIILAFFISCNKEDLNENNDDTDATDQNVLADTLYTTAAEADSAIEECYLKMFMPFSYYVQSFYFSLGGNTVQEHPKYSNLTYDAAERNVEIIYDYLYQGICSCNDVVNNVPNVDMNQADIDQIVAEAQFLRGVNNFYMSVFFNNPPLYTYENQNDSSVTNSEVDELFKHAINDFNMAYPSLPGSYSGMGIRNATQGAADAYKGMCYMWLEDWDSARICFNAVINSGAYDLVMPNGTDSADYFNAYLSNFTEQPLAGYGGDNNIESVFEIQYENDADWWNLMLPGWGCMGSILHQYYGVSTMSWGNMSAKLGAESVFESPGPDDMAADPRRAATFFFMGDTLEYDQSKIDQYYTSVDPVFEGGKFYWDPIAVRKHFFPLFYENNTKNLPYNWRLIRYAEVLLNFAEADFRANGSLTSEGLEAINKIRNRAGMPEYSSVSSDDIVKERLRETMYEVNDVLHLIRCSKTKSATPWVNMLDYNSDFVVNKHEFLPIPFIYLNENVNLQQNQGW